MALHPRIAERVSHLWGAHVLQLLSGEVEGVPSAPPMDRPDVVRTDDVVPGPDGPVAVRWYRPLGLDADVAAPALVWVHGGGWQYGDLDMPESDSVAQVVAAELPGLVVTVDYRLAPAHRHPAALDDVASVVAHVLDRATDLGLDPERIALGGGSAGAHLATLAALQSHAEGHRLGALWLAYPVTDPVGGPYDERHPDCPPVLWLGAEGTCSLFEGYLGHDPHGAPDDVVPARRDLAVLPPTLVTTAEVDSLRAQAACFVQRAAAACAATEHHQVEGVLHGYLNLVGDEPLADAALARHLGWLRSVLSSARM